MSRGARGMILHGSGTEIRLRRHDGSLHLTVVSRRGIAIAALTWEQTATLAGQLLDYVDELRDWLSELEAEGKRLKDGPS